MKLSIYAPIALATMAGACNWYTPVVICFTQPLCKDGDPIFLPQNPEVPVTIQTCSTNLGRGGGPGVGGGGGSCVCVEEGVEVCATFTQFNRNQRKLWVSRTNFKTGEPIGDVVLDLDAPVFIGGDPHIKGWSGNWFDYHGQCDTVMVHSPNFANGLGLDIHVRSKIRYDYSFIETAALKIGDDVLEVSGFGNYLINGVMHAEMPAAIADFYVTHEVINEHDHSYTIELGKGAYLTVKTHNDIVGVGMDLNGGAIGPWFHNSTGLMGSFETGAMLARDGVTILGDPNAIGQEWQVQPSEPQLFHVMDHHPQYPTQCILPSPNAQETRRLGETISHEDAARVCSHWETADARERCIYDVIAVGDLGMATVGAV